MKSFDGYLKLKLGNDYVLLAGGGHISTDFWLEKTSLEWNKLVYTNSSSSNFCIGKFCMYDSCVIVQFFIGDGRSDIGTLTVNTFNVGTPSPTINCYVHGDTTGSLANNIYIKHIAGDPLVEIYYVGGSYIRVFLHIRAFNLMLHRARTVSYPTNYSDIATTIATIPSNATIRPTNMDRISLYFTDLSTSTTNAVSLTIAGVTKNITVSNLATSMYNTIFAADSHKLDGKHLTEVFDSLTRPANTNDIKISIGGTEKSITLGSNAWNSNSYALADNVMTFTDETNYVNASLPQAAAVKAHTKYIEFWDRYTGGGWYNFRIGRLDATSGVKVLDGDDWKDVSLEGHTHDSRYVTAVGQGSGDYATLLYYTKNSVNNYFTVAYATHSNTTDKFKYTGDNWNVNYASNVVNLISNISGSTSGRNSPTGYSSGISVMTSYVGFQLAVHGGSGDAFYFRKMLDNSTWHDWFQIIHSGNWSDFINLTSLGAAPAHNHPYLSTSGGTLSGTLTIAPTNISAWLKGLSFYDSGGGTGETLWIEWYSSSYTTPVKLAGAPDSKTLNFNDGTNWYTVYHSGNLPAYPTKASWNYDDVYLKLTGGTLLNTNFYPLTLIGGTEGAGLQFTLTGSSPKLGIALFKPGDWGMAILNFSASKGIGIKDDGTPYYGWSTKYTLLHTGNSSVSKSGETLTVNIGGTSYSLTNTNTWRGIQDNLTSTSTSDSLSANLGRILNGKFDNYLVKTTYDYHKEFSAGGSGYIEIGCFNLYDSMVGIDVTLTTSSSWNGRLIISSLNINSSGGGSYYATVRGDNSISMHNKFSIVRSGKNFRVYLNCSGWMKVFCHIWCVEASASELFTTVSSMPTGNITINNDSGTFGGNVYASNFYTTSDRTKKQNISPFSEHIRKFQLKDTEKWHYGVIAQEVPEMFRDGEEGNMTVNYNSILSFYIGQLENKVKMLEDEINKLKNK